MYNSRPRIKNERVLRERIEKYISPLYFADVNLHSRLYKYKKSIITLLHFHAPGRISFEEATSNALQYQKVNVGQSFGPTWSTHWFKINLDLSDEPNWKNNEVRLRWNSGSEAMVWVDGEPKQGLTGGDGQIRTDYVLTECCQSNEKLTVYIEMAANGCFGAGKDGLINPPDPNRSFTLSMLEVAVLDYNIYRIIRDLKILIDISQTLPEDAILANKALQVGCDVVNCFEPISDTSHERASTLLNELFESNNIDQSYKHQYNVHAIGHCHIDTAWLWPYAETERKCGRSWSSVICLMMKYPNFKFACSQAVQFDWVKSKYPSLYEDIKKYVACKRFIPIGGTWVEMDGNIPSGEAFCRQFLYGQKYFKKEFGNYCQVFWLPDTFGYSAQLPQIVRQAGMKYFLTQKISWSLVNKLPHNSFIWKGIDGSGCLTHFPPADTYESSATFKDIWKTQNQNKDKGLTSDGMLLYGYGDGGGGPTADMIENLSRHGHIPGLPTVRHSSPVEFFNTLEKSSHLLHTWIGELYLELHQGTFTTQALVKRRNRECEILLQNTEFYQVWSYLKSKDINDIAAQRHVLERNWKKLLLNQFHDVLPGTSIAMVYNDAEKLYQEVVEECSQLSEKMKLQILSDRKDSYKSCFVFNTNSWPRKEVIIVNGYKVDDTITKQTLNDGRIAVVVDVPSMGFALIDENIPTNDHVFIDEDSTTGIIALKNNHLRTKFNKMGQLLSCVLLQNNRECISKEFVGNQFCLFSDIPLFWDAWDVMPYNDETRQLLNTCSSINIVDHGPLRASFMFSLKISEKSTLVQTVSLNAGSELICFDTQVDWHENRNILKVEFPYTVLTDYATYEIQCGHLRRPTHCNTSWDWAKYEVCGHKWVDFSEYDFGVALLNNCKYGFSAYGSTLQMSLLRSSKSPDDHADMGSHQFSYALMPYKGTFQRANVIQRAHDFNNPLNASCFTQNALQRNFSLFQLDNPAVVLQAVKMHEEKEHCIILRMYESFGSHSQVTLTSFYPFVEVYRTNILEDEQIDEDVTLLNLNACSLFLNPFEIITLCVRMQ